MTFLAAAAPILGVLGAGISAAGSLESGLYAAQVSKNNETIANQNADYAEAAGQENAAVESRKGAATQGQILARQGASGVDVNSGSAVDVREGQAETDKLDVDTILNNADLAAYGYHTTAANEEAQSKQDTSGAIFDSLGTIAGNASSLAFKWSTPSSTPAKGPATFVPGTGFAAVQGG